MATKTETEIKRLKRQIAEDESQLDAKRSKLAKLEAKWKGEAAPLTGLELLWKAALPKARERSSKHRCRKAWNLIPQSHRPPVKEAIEALTKWNKCEEWTKEFSQFAPGLHRFIAERMWEDVPEVRDPFAKYRKKPQPKPAEDGLDSDEAIRILNSPDDL